ncbi:MAG: class I SAM-dependent RNA methyltransferase [Faecalibacterium sp.]
MPAKFELIAPCFFGCESTASFELRRIGAEDIRVTDGRLTFRGGAEMIAAANLNLRTVERVMLLLASYRAVTFDDLFDGVNSIPWEELLPADAAFPVTGSSLNSQLSSVPACQSIIKKAIVKRLMKGHRTSVLPETGVEYKIRFMLRKDVCEIMLDTTGEGLHKRGYRRNAMEAPIRETLAATIADLGRVRRDSLVEDPFCGSGTLLIEAAQKAMNLAPGLKRRFAAERYSFVPTAVWAEQRQKALAEAKLDVGFEAIGYDIDPAAVALANANAKLAGVDKRCRFEVADVAGFEARPEAIILTNPPYGERMGTIDGAARLARILGRQMEAHPCTGLYAITADMDFESHYGKRANKRRKMYNGMIPCQLYMYYDAPKTERPAKPMPQKGFDGKRSAGTPPKKL